MYWHEKGEIFVMVLSLYLRQFLMDFHDSFTGGTLIEGDFRIWEQEVATSGGSAKIYALKSQF